MREVWRQAHLKQPLGSRDGSRTRQRGGSDLKSTTGGSRGAPPPLIAPGGSYIKGGKCDPKRPRHLDSYLSTASGGYDDKGRFR